jgi:hypothetical protein
LRDLRGELRPVRGGIAEEKSRVKGVASHGGKHSTFNIQRRTSNVRQSSRRDESAQQPVFAKAMEDKGGYAGQVFNSENREQAFNI